MDKMQKKITISTKNGQNISLDFDQDTFNEKELEVIDKLRKIINQEQDLQIDAEKHFSESELDQIKKMRKRLKLAAGANSNDEGSEPEIRVVRGGDNGEPFVW